MRTDRAERRATAIPNSVRMLMIAASLSVFTETQIAQAAGSYGALATDGRGHFGYAVASPSEAAARDAALKDCGSPGCKVAVAGKERCVASYESRLKGDYGYGVALGADENKVRMGAMARCATRAPAITCKEVKVLCAK
jgi:hypothetical protein